MKSILLIGLGRFGRHIAMHLNELGHQVMAVDKVEERVDAVLPYVTNAQIGDSTNGEFLESLGIRNFDVCIVAIGNDFQSSLETTSLLKELGGKLILNFDCVSDGDEILLVVNKAARKKYGGRLEAAFPGTDEKTVHMEKSSSAMYPSDQAGFPLSVAVAAMKKLPLLGLYLDRIHTGRDRVFDEGNIEYLCKSTIDFLSSAEGGKQI